MNSGVYSGMKHILSLLLLAGVTLSGGCFLQSEDAKATPTDAKPPALQRELDSTRAQNREFNAKVNALEQQFAEAQRDLTGERNRATGLQADNTKLQTENLRLAKIVSRLDPNKPKTVWTRAELEKALLGQTKEEVQRVLGAPASYYGTASPFVKYSRVCQNPATGRVDELVQLNFEAGVLKAVIY